MAEYARIDNGAVAELFETEADITTLFHPELMWVRCDSVEGVSTGWTYDGQTFSAPKPATLTVEEQLAVIAARRYVAEAAGITISDMPIATDRDSQALITGAALAAYLDGTYSCNWKTGDSFVKLDAATILSIAKAVRAHVQACFDREADLISSVKAGTYQESMLEQGWPPL